MDLARNDRRLTECRLEVGAGGSLEALVGALEHQYSIGDLEGRTQLDAHDLDDVHLG